MVFKENFVAVVKVKGKILRENKNVVTIPFDQEYSILLKNLFSRKALVSISIDGQDVLNGKQLIVNANSEIELERFLDNLDSGNKFLFVQKTEKIQEYRGDKIDDGIIRVEWQWEKTLQSYNWNFDSIPVTYKYYSNSNDNNFTYTSDIFCSSNVNVSKSCLRSMNTSCCVDTLSAPLQDEGITVKGSVSDQQFKYGNIGSLESEKHVITLQLKGVNDNGNLVEKVVTVRDKLICTTCGEKNSSSHKFCKECGTFLE